MDKRKISPTSHNPLQKRLRPEESLQFDISTDYTIGALNSWLPQSDISLPTIPASTSKTMHGQTAEVYTCRFSPSGQHIASAGADKGIYLWNTFGDSHNCGIIKGRHIGTIHELHWSRNASTVFTASADKTCGMFDVQTGERIKCFRGHLSAVNSCSLPRKAGQDVFASGSDDGTVKIWDLRTNDAMGSMDSTHPITAVCFSDSVDLIFAGCSNHVIIAWEIRMKRILFSLAGHSNGVAGICLSPDGTQLLSTALDNTVRIWDVDPCTKVDTRLQTTLQGSVAAPLGLETHLSRPAWSNDGSTIGVGTANGEVMVWRKHTIDVLSTRFEHMASVNGVDFHPSEPIVVSCSSDKRLVIGEINLR